MIDIKYKGTSGYETYGVVARSVRRLLPPLRKREAQVPGKSGTYDFGYNEYENATVTADISFKSFSPSEMRKKAREVAAWLRSTTYEPLIFSDEPDKYYLAKIYSESPLQTLIKLGQCQIQFECQPMCNYIVSTGEDLTWDTDLVWDTDITWNTRDDFKFSVTSSPTTVEFENFGTVETSMWSQPGSTFTVTITGSFTTLSLTVNGSTINYNQAVSNKVVVFDCINGTIKTDGVNKLSVCTGSIDTFFESVPGTNTVSIGGTGLNCSVLIDLKPQYI